MTELDPRIRDVRLHAPRAARLDDAADLAELADMAGEGLPFHVWSQLARPGQTPWDVGRERARRETGSFSYRHAAVFDRDGAVAGCLIGCPLPEEVAPIPADMPALFRPLQELENQVPGSWYVNFLAVRPEHRGQGLGTRLLAHADAAARAAGTGRMSVIAVDSNLRALALYARCGYRPAAVRPMIKDGWDGPGRSWVLLTKTV